jgi:hypothetical protein
MVASAAKVMLRSDELITATDPAVQASWRTADAASAARKLAVTPRVKLTPGVTVSP